MRLTREDILHLAELAKLELTETEVKQSEGDLERILGYVERLAQVDTDSVEPFSQPNRATWRPDSAEPSSETVREGLINNFPEKQGALLKTPGVFAHPKS